METVKKKETASVLGLGMFHHYLVHLRRICSSHRLIIAHATAMALCMVFPLIMFPLITLSTYRGINIANHGNDEMSYLSRGKEILEGYQLGDSLFREGKNGQDPNFTYVEYWLLFPVKFFGIDHFVTIPTLYAFFNTFGIFFLIILLYAFLWELSYSRLLSTIGALTVIGGYAFVSWLELFAGIFYSQAVSPYLPLLFTFLYLNFLLRSFHTVERKALILPVLSFGALFYVYFYAWSFIFVFNIVLCITFLILKEYQYVKRLLIILGGGVLIGLPALLQLAFSFFSSTGRTLRFVSYLEQGNAPIFSIVGFFSLLLFILFYFKRKGDKHIPVIFALLVSGWIVLNQQVATGFSLQPEHYYKYFVTPSAILTGLYMIWSLLKDDRYRRILFVALCTAVYVNVGIGQIRGLRTNFSLKQYRQQYRPILDALNDDKNPAVVFTADDQQAYLVTIYTPHDLFWVSNTLVAAGLPMKRFEDTLFLYSYMNKESRNNFVSFFTHTVDGMQSSYGALYQMIEGILSGYSFQEYNHRIAVNDSELKTKNIMIARELDDLYEFLRRDTTAVKCLFAHYGIRYIIWDKHLHPEWDISFLEPIQPLVMSGDILLYRLSPDMCPVVSKGMNI